MPGICRRWRCSTSSGKRFAGGSWRVMTTCSSSSGSTRGRWITGATWTCWLGMPLRCAATCISRMTATRKGWTPSPYAPAANATTAATMEEGHASHPRDHPPAAHGHASSVTGRSQTSKTDSASSAGRRRRSSAGSGVELPTPLEEPRADHRACRANLGDAFCAVDSRRGQGVECGRAVEFSGEPGLGLRSHRD
jgi:hypothetical protein